MYIGGDTGVMHLAALAGTPVVSIFGPTDIRVNAAFTDNVKVIRRELPCSPCKKRDCQDRRCLNEIGVEEVLEAVWSLYTERRGGPRLSVRGVHL
jgi:ADP-heptose:LPS heptosyltransferase